MELNRVAVRVEVSERSLFSSNSLSVLACNYPPLSPVLIHLRRSSPLKQHPLPLQLVAVWHSQPARNIASIGSCVGDTSSYLKEVSGRLMSRTEVGHDHLGFALTVARAHARVVGGPGWAGEKGSPDDSSARAQTVLWEILGAPSRSRPHSTFLWEKGRCVNLSGRFQDALVEECRISPESPTHPELVNGSLP
ncbi:unnamed protein product [Mesocestoides corti]|uniref:Uncharacterized protein n=1 Tax=Mesocestoides corti TaxID=53468 RepID=A0A0R3UJ10_MESCO|nr:unnamed protein product [Mesocestoides corti]